MLVLGLLGIYTIQDLKRRRIWWPPAVCMAAAGIWMNRQTWAQSWQIPALALVPGILLLLCALLPAHPVGAGDGLTAVACGAICGLDGVLELLMLAFLMCAAWAAFLLVFRRAGRRDRVPFMPFLLAAQICLCFFR